MKEVDIELKVNGIDYQVKTVPWRTLVEVLREDLGLMGTKKSCNEGKICDLLPGTCHGRSR
jgi:aerobic-type carbon monoxide dehydrogenase small subunit (CoxS/CutS family)